MTSNSLAVAINNDHPVATRGSTPAPRLSPVSFEVPPQFARLLSLSYDGSFADGVALKALSQAKAEGLADAIPALAQRAVDALQPITHKALIDRLTALGMMMAYGKKDDLQVEVWLCETARLLGDLPVDILCTAIDECIRDSPFLPSVADIRSRTEDRLRQRHREAARLSHLAKLIEQGVEVPDYDPDKPAWQYPRSPKPEPVEDRCSPEDAAAILAEFGFSSSFQPHIAKALQPKREQSRAEQAAQGIEPQSKPKPSDDWAMMA